MVLLAMVLFAISGCRDSKAPTTSQAGPPPAAPEAGSTKNDPLANVLRLSETGDVDGALEKLVDNAPDNWIESTSLEGLRISEADFAAKGRADKSRLQQQFIDRAGEIKGFARKVMERADEAKKRGDEETAQRYIRALNRLGQQLRDADTVIVLQQTGSVLANLTLAE